MHLDCYIGKRDPVFLQESPFLLLALKPSPAHLEFWKSYLKLE